MKIALVHDFLTQYGGAERFLEAVISFFGEESIEIYTLRFNPHVFPAHWKRYTIHSLARNFPKIDYFSHFYFFYVVPLIEKINFSAYDLVFSSDLIFAKYVIVPAHIPHISYQHTPAAMLYPYQSDVYKRSIFAHLAGSIPKSFLRAHEYIASQRIDRLLTNSQTTAERISKYYNRDAEVVYSFVDIPSEEEFRSLYNERGEYYICISRLVQQKRIDLVVQACRELQVPLIVIGDGPERAWLEEIGKGEVTFTGFVSDEEKAHLLGKSIGLVFPGVEDLGLTPLEAMAWGKGVIAFGQGGVTETVIDGKTGMFFNDQSVMSLSRALRDFRHLPIDPQDCREQAQKFSRKIFNARLQKVVDELIQNR